MKAFVCGGILRTAKISVTETDPEYINPDWSNSGRVHDWRNYVNPSLRENWPTFSAAQKQILFENAQEIADREEWD